MTVSEKVAYLKGLMEGMKLDESKDEVKLTQKIIEVLEDMALTISDLEDSVDIIGEQVDAVDEDLDELEGYVYDDECDDDCCCDDDDVYEVKCPKCGNMIYVDGDILDEGEIDCPSCGEKLEFDIDFDADEEDGAEDK
ncbi:MAG: CD1247 N-terminal domain-containing protein [Clostridia bacterium]